MPLSKKKCICAFSVPVIGPYVSGLFSKSSLARLQEFWNSSICLYEIKRKNLFKSTCPTGNFTCPGPSGSGKPRALCVKSCMWSWSYDNLSPIAHALVHLSNLNSRSSDNYKNKKILKWNLCMAFKFDKWHGSIAAMPPVKFKGNLETLRCSFMGLKHDEFCGKISHPLVSWPIWSPAMMVAYLTEHQMTMGVMALDPDDRRHLYPPSGQCGWHGHYMVVIMWRQGIWRLPWRHEWSRRKRRDDYFGRLCNAAVL